jgi:23S rRNA (cytosine1962-C5)-methyltransferase
VRALEGLAPRVGAMLGTVPPAVRIEEDGIAYEVDVARGQKTGFYLDQRENRIAMRRFMPGARVLDLFSNYGGFALHAAHAGAASVVAIDSSAAAVAEIAANRALNELGPIDARVEDVFSALQEIRASGELFDVVIADPPPFARSKKNVAAARKKYVELFALSLASLAPGGTAFLATCSHHITRDTFLEMLRESLFKARRGGIILEERGASPDHPIHPQMPETSYLHGAIVKV